MKTDQYTSHAYPWIEFDLVTSSTRVVSTTRRCGRCGAAETEQAQERHEHYGGYGFIGMEPFMYRHYRCGEAQ